MGAFAVAHQNLARSPQECTRLIPGAGLAHFQGCPERTRAEKEKQIMYEKRATVPDANSFAETGPTDGGIDQTIQTRRRLSRSYIPVYHVELVRDRTIQTGPRTAVHNADDVVEILRDELLRADREKLICLILNAKNVIVGMDIVSVGSLTSSIAHPREIFKAAILKNAAAIILSHGHPLCRALHNGCYADIAIMRREFRQG
ncbi:MAG: hypothetical protein HY645_11635 [Acidobacteria bacterium]|nr:hypothetical protein [Acidobacteriota bacterium]